MRITRDELHLAQIISTLSVILEKTWNNGSELGFHWWDNSRNVQLSYEPLADRISIYSKYLTLTEVQILAVRGLCDMLELTYVYMEF